MIVGGHAAAGSRSPVARSRGARRESDSPCMYSMTRKSSPSARPTSSVGDDVGVTDARREPRLVEEHRDELGVLRELRVQPLDGDGTREAHRTEQAPEVHGGHAARGDLVVERVAPDEGPRVRRD